MKSTGSSVIRPRGSWNNERGQGEAAAWIFQHSTYEGDECLIWPFSHAAGYGQLSYCGKLYRAPRLMCEIINGPPPTPRHQAAHSCGNGDGGCMTPRHLSWKTNGENQIDRRIHGTMYIGSKFTAERHAELLSLKGKKTEVELAIMFGVSRSTIHYQLNRDALRAMHRKWSKEKYARQKARTHQ